MDLLHTVVMHNGDPSAVWWERCEIVKKWYQDFFFCAQVKAVQDDIIESQPHLQDAAIPLQDLHLTLFVATLHEEDGTLQVDGLVYQSCFSTIYDKANRG